MTMASILSVALSIAIAFLLLTHLFFAFTASSTIESGKLQLYNPFFQSVENGTKRTYEANLRSNSLCKQICNFSRVNFYQLFGTNLKYWFLPIKTPDKYLGTDGINWKLRLNYETEE